MPRIGSPSIFFSFIIFPYISFCSSVIDLDILGSQTGFGIQSSKEMPTLVSIVDLPTQIFCDYGPSHLYLPRLPIYCNIFVKFKNLKNVKILFVINLIVSLCS